MALDRLGLKLGKAQAQLLFKTLDADDSGEVDIDECVVPTAAAAAAVSRQPLPQPLPQPRTPPTPPTPHPQQQSLQPPTLLQPPQQLRTAVLPAGDVHSQAGGHGRFMAMAFDSTFGDSAAGEDEGPGGGLGSWATWTQDDGPQITDGVNYTEQTAAVLRRQYMGVKRPAADLAWPASVLQAPGYRTGAEVAQRALASRTTGYVKHNLPELNPADNPATFFRQPEKPRMTNAQAAAAATALAAGGDVDPAAVDGAATACISTVLEEWNERWRHGKGTSTRQLGGWPQPSSARTQALPQNAANYPPALLILGGAVGWDDSQPLGKARRR